MTQEPPLSFGALSPHPPLLGLAPLMRMALSGADLTPLKTGLIARATTHADDANALLDLSTVLQLMMQHDLAMGVQAQALQMQQLYHLPSSNASPGLRILVIMGPGDLMANAPLECLLEGSDVDMDILYVDLGLASPTWIPEHDLLFCAVNQSEYNDPLLQHMENVLAEWPRPVVNAPAAIRRLSRDGAWAWLKSLPGLVMPQTVRVERAALEQLARGETALSSLLESGTFPVILRPVDSHAGHSLVKCESPVNIMAYLQAQKGAMFYLAPFVDYRSADGQYRKYRIMLIDGRPYACHLAISDDWMIHYLNAGMDSSAQKRAEEASFMADFDEGFARRHAETFQALADQVGLPCFGMDCAETPDGKLLAFEVDVGMVVHDMDPVALYPYKKPQMQKVFTAFRQMLARHAAKDHGTS